MCAFDSLSNCILSKNNCLNIDLMVCSLFNSDFSKSNAVEAFKFGPSYRKHFIHNKLYESKRSNTKASLLLAAECRHYLLDCL